MPDVFTVFLNKDDDDDDHRTPPSPPPPQPTYLPLEGFSWKVEADTFGRFSISIKRFKNDICATIYTE